MCIMLCRLCCRRQEDIYLWRLALAGSGGEGEFVVGNTERACKSPVLNAVRLMPFLFSPAAAAAAMTTCNRKSPFEQH